jgi:predicted transposase/invertase (TIGR01784 family)
MIAENEDILDIRSDPVFKAVFTKNTDESRGALTALLSAFTGHKVIDFEIRENEPAISDIGNRQIRFDISVKFNSGKLANIEMNMYSREYDLQRGELYLDELHTTQNIKGKDLDYSDLKETYQISFLNDMNYFEDGEPIHHFEFYDKDNRISLGGLTHMVTVELEKIKAIKENELKNVEEKWAYFFKNCREPEKRNEINKLLKEEEGINMALESLMTISKDENERARLLTLQKNLVDWQSGIVYAKKQGRKEVEAELKPIIAQKDNQLAQQAAEIAELKRQLGQTK